VLGLSQKQTSLTITVAGKKLPKTCH